MGFREAIGFDFDVLPHNLLSNEAEILTETIVFVMDFMGEVTWERKCIYGDLEESGVTDRQRKRRA